jgi:hypothetical protein
MEHPGRRTSAAVMFGFCAIAWPLLGQSPSLDDVLKRARESVARHGEQAQLLLADEQCDQKAFESTLEPTGGAYAFRGVPNRVDPRGRRRWQAELALIRTPTLTAIGYPWTEFRDVVSVDGRPLTDRTQRLSRLFLDSAGWSLESARQIAQESARFNIGSLARTVNTPAVPLLVLHPANAARFLFEKSGEEIIDKIRAWAVAFREKTAPTLISADNSNCPASGTVWIDPATGDVLRATLQCSPLQSPDCVSQMTVTYRRDARLGIRVPVEMRERPEGLSPKTSFGQAGRVWIEGRCTYSNFRRFETAAKMIAPK